MTISGASTSLVSDYVEMHNEFRVARANWTILYNEFYLSL